jgi:hypothetical protein
MEAEKADVRVGSWLRDNVAACRTRRATFLKIANDAVSVRETARIRLAEETRFPSDDVLSGFSRRAISADPAGPKARRLDPQ